MSIQITTTELPIGYVGQVYNAQLTAEVSPVGSAVTWEVRNALPPYLALNPVTGVLAGQCQREFWSSITFWAQNQTTGEVDNVVLPLYVAQAASLEILTAELKDATVGQAYEVTLTGNGGTPPYNWQAEGLPAGLTCTDGQILGTPTQSGNFQVTLTLADASIPSSSTSVVLPLSVRAAVVPLRVHTDSLLPGVIGQTYAQGLSAAGGISPYTWAAQNLPTGLQVDGDVISGIPTQAGSLEVSLQVTDAASPASFASSVLPLVISSTPTVLAIATQSLAIAKTNEPYYQLLEASGGVPPYRWSSDGLPIGLLIDSNSIIGQPTVSGGSVPLTLTVTDSQQATASQFFWLAVQDG